MKVLKIHKNGRQIETLVLHRPTHLIGRSPHCDLVLRAKDVLSIHFIAEWLGTGDFDPEVGEWTLFSTKSTGEKNHEAYNKRGVVLGSKMSSLDGFEFSLDADSLNQAPEIGGHYKRGLTEAHNRGASDPSQELCLEVSQVHAATGSIESVQHFSYESKYASKFRPLSEMPQVSIKWKAFRAAHDFDFSSLKDSEIFFGNDPLPPPQRQKLSLAPYQIVIAKLNNKDVYFRLVTKSKPVPIQKVFFEDRTMRKLFLALFIPLLVIFSALFLIEPFEKEPEPEKTPSRVVRIEAPPPAPTPVAAEMPSTP
ncbi:MAG TPA: FHA domain-containing protein, partial [Bdellovibrionota bacterium]|nr:FHA domain-containing protein [Bdellovibrionota bacterium]